MQTSVHVTIKIIVISRKCPIFTLHNKTFKCPPFVEVLMLPLDCVVNDRLALALGPRQSDYCIILYIKYLKRYILLEL